MSAEVNKGEFRLNGTSCVCVYLDNGGHDLLPLYVSFIVYYTQAFLRFPMWVSKNFDVAKITSNHNQK